MITIIHGDDIVSSRNFLVGQKQKIKNPLEFNGESIAISDLVQIFEGGELFSDQKTLFLEDFLTKRKASKDKDQILSYLSKYQNHDIFLWEGKEVSAKSLSAFKKAEVKHFKLPQSLFLFLDSLKPGRGKLLIPLFHKTLENMEAEFVFYMLVRQFRLLLALSDLSSKEQIDEIKRMAPWQKSKLQRQAFLFTKDALTKNFAQLYAIDLAQKTGSLSLSLIQTIDFFLLDL
ncbi:MAG: hypothetical protein HYY87_01175 [Candidatus Levybacteria bacterium]|nr:hypothetical protein [Candidatus Levybacteria bacterium]MBI2190012.1 hypothetical protein [Candidatus Levybacteria bacterium]MBI3069899.1 hypothetical protein [Candidatus Levybacteria bacterium]